MSSPTRFRDRMLPAAMALSILAAPAAIAAEIAMPEGCETLPVYDAPDWYADNRLHFHFALSALDPRLGLARSYLETPEFRNVETWSAETGARVISRHIKTMNESPWFGSSAAEPPVDTSALTDTEKLRIDPPATNFLPVFTDAAAKVGVKSVLYYWHMGELREQIANPDWICRKPDGEPEAHIYKGAALDITGPYSNIVKRDFQTMVDAGVQGVYLDSQHIPAVACFGTQLEREFQAAGGNFPPDRKLWAKLLPWFQYKARRVERTLTDWRTVWENAVGERAFIVSAGYVPALGYPYHRAALARCGIPKSELHLPAAPGLGRRLFELVDDAPPIRKDTRIRFGLSYLRDINLGLPPHIWTLGFPNRAHTLAGVSALLTTGSIANLYLSEERIGSEADFPGVTPYDGVRDAVALSNAVSGVLDHTFRPWTPVAILFSETLRDQNVHPRDVGRKAVFPVLAAAQTLQDMGRSYGVFADLNVVNDELPDELATLIVPNRKALEEPVRQGLERLEARGVRIVDLADYEGLSFASSYEAASTKLKQALADSAAADVSVAGLAPGDHVSVFVSDKHEAATILITPRFDWLQYQFFFKPLSPDKVNPAPQNGAGAYRIELGETLRAKYWRSQDYTTISQGEALRIDTVPAAKRGGSLEIEAGRYLSLVSSADPSGQGEQKRKD